MYSMQRVEGQSLVRRYGGRGTRNEGEILAYNFRCFIVLVKVWNPHFQCPKSSGSLTVSISHYSGSTQEFSPKTWGALLVQVTRFIPSSWTDWLACASPPHACKFPVSTVCIVLLLSCLSLSSTLN